MSERRRRTWLQLYVDAMTEKDPYKRLALVRELRCIRRRAKKTANGREKKTVAQRRMKNAKAPVG